MNYLAGWLGSGLVATGLDLPGGQFPMGCRTCWLPWGLSCLTSPVESWGDHKGSSVRFAGESKVAGPGLIQLGVEGASGYYERHRDNTVPDCA